jgi:hypothetical protein
VVGAAFGQQSGEALLVDRLVRLHRGAPVTELHGGGRPVQLHVGRAEARPVVVVVAAEGLGRLIGAADQVTDRGAVADAGRGHRAVEQQHPVDAEAFRRGLFEARRQPVGDVDVHLERGAGPAERQ